MKIKQYLIIFLVIIVIIFILAFIQSRQNKPEKQTATTNQSSWQSIIPGKTNVNDLIKLLGQPESLDGSTLYYPSENKYWKNEITTNQQTVGFIKEKTFDNKNLSEQLIKYPTQPTRLYGPDANSEIYLYVLPDHGIAYLANEQQDVIYENWYFPVMNIEEFLSQPETQDFSLARRPSTDN